MELNKILNIKKTAGRHTAILIPLILFVVSFLYLLIFLDSLFHYQENNSLFIYTAEYLQKFINKPGGLLEYTGNFLAQGYFSPLYGSIIVALLIVILYFIFVKTGKELTNKIHVARILALLPSALLLLAQTNFEHFMHFNLGFLAVAGYFMLSVRSEKRYVKLICVFLFPVFYYLTGSFAFIFTGLFIFCSLMFEKGIHRILMPVILLLVSTASFLIFKDIVFYQPVKTLTGYPVSFHDPVSLRTMIIILTSYFILYPLLLKAGISFQFRNTDLSRFEPAAYIIIFLLLLLSLLKFYNPDLVKILRLEKMIADADWDGIITQQEKSPVPNVIAEYYYNLALSEKEIMCEKMFHGPQDFGPGSLSLPRTPEYYNRSMYFYYTIGIVNEARHLAYESMVALGLRPGNLKMLIKTELINGNYRVAEKYINDLGKTLHYRKQASKYEKLLKNPDLIRSDPELGRKLLLLPGTDFFIRPDDRDNINLLFYSNPSNLKAFEYRLARMLLEKDYKAAVNEIRNMQLLGYKTIPRHLEEAAVGYSNITKLLPDLGGLAIRPEAEKDFYEYGSAYNLYSNSKEMLAEKMKKDWGKTYWYYLQFK